MNTAFLTRSKTSFQPGYDIPDLTGRQDTMCTPSSTVIDRTSDTDGADGSAINPCAVYNLRNCFEYIRETFAADAAAREIALSLEMDSDISVAYWDMHSLRQLVLNRLLAVAIANAPAGGKVAIRITKPDDYTVAIHVENPDARFPRAQRDELSGSLHQAQRCIQAHKGRFELADAASGPAFRIELPLYALCIE